MKKALLLLLSVSFYCSIAAVSVFAGQTITINTDVSAYIFGNGNPNNNGAAITPMRDPNDNKVIINAGAITAPGIYGGYVSESNASVTGNSIIINGGTVSSHIGRSLYGGRINDGSGEVINNSVIINGVSVDGTIYGGFSSSSFGRTGKIVGNSVIITSATHRGSIFGGSSMSGDTSGDVTGNSVVLANVTISNGGDNILGGNSYIGNVNGNSVTIDSGAVAGAIYGGFVGSIGNAYGNKIFLTKVTSSSNIYGGWVYDAGNAVGNVITINGGTVGGSGRRICGGYIDDDNGSGSAINNAVNINAGNITGSVYGGYSNSSSSNSNVTGNSVTFSSGEVAGGDILGGWINGEGNVTGNEVIINGGRALAVYGGLNDGSGNANDNRVTFSSGSVRGAIYGGFSAGGGNAEGNKIFLTNVTVSSNVYGGRVGYTYSGNAVGNVITINGGTVGSSSYRIYGGYIDYGNGSAINNRVIIDSGTINGRVYGGYSSSRSTNSVVTGNSVTINGGRTSDLVYGGYASSGAVTGNSITVNGDGMAANIYGGYVANGVAADNIITINSGTVTSTIYGGYAYGAGSAATGNIITINGGICNTVYGGFITGSGSGDATGNIITINGGTVNGIIVGGDSYGAGMMGSGNIITINGGTVNASVFGGRYGNSATGNIINISGNPTFGSAVGLCGGDISENDKFTGNTLNVNNYTGSSFGSVRRFQYYNFTFSGNQSGPVIKVNTAYLGYDQSPVLASTSIVTANTIAGTPVLKAGSSVTLIETSDLQLYGFNQTQAEGKHGSFVSYDWILSTATGNLTATLANVKADKETKIISEGAAAGAILAGEGAGLAAGELLSNLQEGKAEAVATVFGGNSKYDTGSSVEMSVFGVAAGVVKKFGSFSAGIFLEYAGGSFDTEYSSVKGDGSASAVGAGILAKKDIAGNVYVEGLIRAGQLTNDYKANISGTAADFDYSTMYFGFGLGIGKIFKVSETISIDCFGKYALTSTGESDADLASGEKYKMDSILSNRIKAGAKGEFKISDAFKPYITISYDHELSGDINAQMDGLDIEAPTLNGGTFSAGIGASAKITEKVTLDLSGQFYSGVREGITGSLKAKYSF